MGRELRRKQAKKEGKSLEREEIIEQNPIRKFIVITIILLIIMAIIYLATSLFITKELDWFSKKEKVEETKETVSDSILASAIFKQKEAEYYVYFYDFYEEKDTVTSFVTQRLSGTKLYKVNTTSAMNAKYVSETSNKQAKTLEELKVKAPTVIKIENGKITKYYEENEIVNNL